MTRTHRADAAPLYAVAAQWVGRCLREDGSLFQARDRLWTLEGFRVLHELSNQQPDPSKDPYLVKLGRQLSTASDEPVLLFAEMLYMRLLIANDIGGSAKRDKLDAVLGHFKDPVEVPSI